MINRSPVIEFREVSKHYKLGEVHRGLRHALPDFFRRLAGRGTKSSGKGLWALDELSFTVSTGQAMGIIGPNGGGKTTTLKLATSVTRPTTGYISVRGRISSLIELGAGFHPELTGRENIYLNGTILGLKRKEISERFDRIVAFSELEDFLDTPVKRYSSGMYARLGFSVAAHVEPDVLVIDEVLAVGDRRFVPKCYKRMADLKAAGTTILLVTHDLDMMQRLCDRAILLHRGRMVETGAPEDVVARYLDDPRYASNFAESADSLEIKMDASDTRDTETPVSITSVRFLDVDENEITSCRSGDTLIIQMVYETRQPIVEPSFEFKIHGINGSKYADHNTARDGLFIGQISGRGQLKIRLDDLVLPPGLYEFSLAISDAKALSKYADHRRMHRFQVTSGRPGSGLTRLPHRWILDGVQQ